VDKDKPAFRGILALMGKAKGKPEAEAEPDDQAEPSDDPVDLFFEALGVTPKDPAAAKKAFKLAVGACAGDEPEAEGDDDDGEGY
jgi:hypothetical protein